MRPNMPLFEYQCSQCEYQFETLVRGSEMAECPECRSRKLDKLLSATAPPVVRSGSLPIAGGCPPADAPPCNPNCCRLP